MPPRPTPYDLVFVPLGEERFSTIRQTLENTGQNARDRDAFFLAADAAALVHELRPDEGMGEGIAQLAALVHHAYLFWRKGLVTVDLDLARLELLLSSEAGPAPREPPAVAGAGAAVPLASYYVRFPAHRIWAEAIPGEPHEPLDGCFVHRADPDSLQVLGVFGLHPDRVGFTVVEAEGPRPVGLSRPDGTPLFAPVLAGGAAAALHSLVGAEELLELGWRTYDAVAGERLRTGARENG